MHASINRDLRREEALVQIADCLQLLQQKSKATFERIQQRLAQVEGDVQAVAGRSQSAQLVIESLQKWNNKAICLNSAPEYLPAGLFDPLQFRSITADCCKDVADLNLPDRRQHTIRQSHIPFHDGLIDEKLHVFDFQSWLDDVDSSDNEPPQTKPTNYDASNAFQRITSVSSLLLFNSSELVHGRSTAGSQSVVSQRPLSVSQMQAKIRKQQSETDAFRSGVEIVTNDLEDKSAISVKDSQYTLDFDSAPDLFDDLPTDLPNLTGIAEDLAGQSFVASKKAERIEAKTVTTKGEHQTTCSLQPQFSVAKHDVQPSTSKPAESGKLGTFAESAPVTPPPMFLPTTPPPPPPPMPPPMPPAFASPTRSSELRSTPIASPLPVVDDDSARAGLLDAIRKAKGRPERKTTVKERKIEQKKHKKEVVSNDLMSDLKSHLLSRRKGIGGLAKEPVKDISKVSISSPMFDRVNKLLESPDESSDSSSDQSDENWMD